MITPYTQTTFQTCLAVNLLQAVGKSSKKTEMECIMHSMLYSKPDFAAGHLDYITKNYPLRATRIIDNAAYHAFIQPFNPPAVNLLVQPVTLRLIDSLITRKPIINLDCHFLGTIPHLPHYITILRKQKDLYTIFDPWDGAIKTMPAKTISKAIRSLRNRLRIAPQLIHLDHEKENTR